MHGPLVPRNVEWKETPVSWISFSSVNLSCVTGAKPANVPSIPGDVSDEVVLLWIKIGNNDECDKVANAKRNEIARITQMNILIL